MKCSSTRHPGDREPRGVGWGAAECTTADRLRACAACLGWTRPCLLTLAVHGAPYPLCGALPCVGPGRWHVVPLRLPPEQPCVSIGNRVRPRDTPE